MAKKSSIEISSVSLKGGNILMNNIGVLKIADFGLARTFNHQDLNMTLNVVTRCYRAPEVLYGNKAYDEKIDIWSCGSINQVYFWGNVYKKDFI